MAIVNQPAKKTPTPEERERGARFRAAWTYKGLTLGKIAGLLHTSERTVQRMYTGETEPDAQQLRVTIDTTGVPAWFFDQGWQPPLNDAGSELEDRVDTLEGQMDTVLDILTRRVAALGRDASGPSDQAESEGHEDTQ